MNARLARTITRLYPPAWRERYGEEFAAMLELGPGDLGALVDSVGAAVREHIFPTRFPARLATGGGNMETVPVGFGSVIKDPGAYLPLGMSILALALVTGAVGVDVARAGHVVHQADEGTLAHIWQLLMTVQMPLVLYFAIKWLGRAPGPALRVLGMQMAAWLASCAPVYFLHL